jgi:molecular chaperone GrpE
MDQDREQPTDPVVEPVDGPATDDAPPDTVPPVTGPDAGEPVEPSEPAEPTPQEQPDWEALAAADPRSPAELLAELTEAEARRDEYLEDVRRARAEFENYRKRTMKEATGQRDHGRADVAVRLLDVLDDFDRTLDAAQGSSDEGLSRGVELVYGKLVSALRELGLARIDATGVPFDPTRHEAVQEVAADEPGNEPVVAEVFRPGYEMSGRVLRAAMVVVKQ